MRLSVADLCVVHFRSRYLTDEIKAWREERPVPFAESCDRQVWYGFAETFSDFPALPDPSIKNPTIHLLKGKDAYAFLLKLVIGFDSKKLGESNIKRQFLEGLELFQKEYTEFARSFGLFADDIKADTRLIQNEICTGFKHQRYELCAKDLSGYGGAIMRWSSAR